MSGHSKWATTKRHKAAIDAKRGKLFSIISKELTIAAKAGGGDPEFNPRLRTVMNAAKDANMPADNIKRAIQKGTGELPGTIIEEITYEGYAPGGVGVIVEVTTDNRNRSTAEVRSTFTKNGGSLASTGAVSYGFERKGQFLISSDKATEDGLLEMALDAGAEDVVSYDDHFEVFCPLAEFDKVVRAFEEKGIQPDSAELSYIPSSTISVDDVDTVRQVLRLIDKLDDLEDVKNVYANFDIDENLIEESEKS